MENKKIRVYNRSNSTVFYKDEETNKTRVWEPVIRGNESYKDLPFDEIERMLNNRGGRVLFEEYLLIKDKDICDELELECPEEYFYDTKKIIEILEKGSDFDLVKMIKNSPEGIKDSIKQIAIEIQLDSSRKRKIIKDQLGFDVNFAIENNIDFANNMTSNPDNKETKEKEQAANNNKYIYETE